MVRQWPNQFRPGGYIPQVPTNQFDTSHGVNSYTFLPWWDVEKTSMNSGGRHYSNPNSLQWSSIIPYLNSAAINTLDASPVNNVDVDAQVGTVRGWTKFSSRKNPQANVRYALALTNLGGSQKYRTAYRYEMVYGDKKDISTPYLELRKEAIVKNIERRQPPYIKDRNTFESQNVAFATFSMACNED